MRVKHPGATPQISTRGGGAQQRFFFVGAGGGRSGAEPIAENEVAHNQQLELEIKVRLYSSTLKSTCISAASIWNLKAYCQLARHFGHYVCPPWFWLRVELRPLNLKDVDFSRGTIIFVTISNYFSKYFPVKFPLRAFHPCTSWSGNFYPP